MTSTMIFIWTSQAAKCERAKSRKKHYFTWLEEQKKQYLKVESVAAALKISKKTWSISALASRLRDSINVNKLIQKCHHEGFSRNYQQKSSSRKSTFFSCSRRKKALKSQEQKACWLSWIYVKSLVISLIFCNTNFHILPQRFCTVENSHLYWKQNDYLFLFGFLFVWSWFQI